MGDMADFYTNQILDEWGADNENFNGGDPAKRCKYCGAFPLFWLNKKGRWVLIDQKGDEHRCKISTRAVDPFADADRVRR